MARSAKLGKAAIRWLFFAHRWLGIAACLLFAMWFVSGLVMMYVRFPALTDAERLARSPPIAWDQVAVSPEVATAQAGLGPDADGPTLRMQGSEPVYVFARGRQRAAVSAVDGRRIAQVGPGEATRIVRAAYPGASPRVLATLQSDQWTVAGRYDAQRPLHLLSLGDRAGSRVYVSGRTGEIVLDTARAERGWNWLGAVPHWLYFRALRANGGAWEQVVLWTSGVGMVAAAAGMVVGVLRLRLRRRYAGGRVSPYRGWMKWHHLAGVIGGVAVLTWVFSGWMSMNPNGWGGGQVDLRAMRAAWAGPPDSGGVALTAVAAVGQGAREARFTRMAGRDAVLLVRAAHDQRLVDGRTGRPATPSHDALIVRAAVLVPAAEIVRVERLTAEDRYWYGHHREVALPVLRVVFDDPEATWVYLDPATGQVAGADDRGARSHRWTFAALHSLDFGLLTHHRPAWDLLLIALSAAGLFISVSGVVVGWRRLRRDVGGAFKTSAGRLPS